MLKPLMFVSGWVEIVFGVSALIVPLLVIEAVGGTGAGAATLALIRLLGAATLGLGVAALLARNHLDGAAGLAAAYGLGLYNVLGAGILLFAAITVGGAGLWGGAVLHITMGGLFVYALAMRRGDCTLC
jgi:hypothetical protein